MEKKYTFGDKGYMVQIRWTLVDGRFSASASMKGKGEDCCGQIIDRLAELFPDDELVQRIYKVWKRWHLNDMNAGSPRQQEFLRRFEENLSYENSKEKLKEAGLDPDDSYIYNGKPYSYGSAWIKEEIPEDVINEINSWEVK